MAGLREQATLRPVTRAGRGRSPAQLSSGGPEPRLLTAAPSPPGGRSRLPEGTDPGGCGSQWAPPLARHCRRPADDLSARRAIVLPTTLQFGQQAADDGKPPTVGLCDRRRERLSSRTWQEPPAPGQGPHGRAGPWAPASGPRSSPRVLRKLPWRRPVRPRALQLAPGTSVVGGVSPAPGGAPGECFALAGGWGRPAPSDTFSRSSSDSFPRCLFLRLRELGRAVRGPDAC